MADNRHSLIMLYDRLDVERLETIPDSYLN